MTTNEEIGVTKSQIEATRKKLGEIMGNIEGYQGNKESLFKLVDELDELVKVMPGLLIPGTYLEPKVDVLCIKTVYGLGKVFQAMEDYPAAISYYQIAVYEMIKRNCLMGIAKTRFNIVTCCLGRGDSAEKITPYLGAARDAIEKARLLSQKEEEIKILTDLRHQLFSISF